jgi:hypothetical protein
LDPTDAGGDSGGAPDAKNGAYGNAAGNVLYLKPLYGLAQNVGLSDKDKGSAMNSA